MADCDDIETLQLEFEEFKAEAKEYEAELEAELKEKDRVLIELTNRLGLTEARLATLQAAYTQSEEIVGRLTRHLQEMTDKEAKARTAVRRLENDVDSLENTLRSLEFSKEDLEEQLYTVKEEEVMLKEMLAQAEERASYNLRRLEEKNQDLADELFSLSRCQPNPTALYVEIGNIPVDNSPIRRSTLPAEMWFPFDQVFESKSPDSVKFAPVRLRLEEFKKGNSCCILISGSERASNASLMLLTKALLYLKDFSPLTLRCEEVSSHSKTMILPDVHVEQNLLLENIAGRRLCRDSSLVWTFTSASETALQIVELSHSSLPASRGVSQLIFDGSVYSKMQDTLIGQALAPSMKQREVKLMSYLIISVATDYPPAAFISKIPKPPTLKINAARSTTPKVAKPEVERNVKSYALKCVQNLEKELASCKSALKVKEARITALTSRLKRKELMLRQYNDTQDKVDFKLTEVVLSHRSRSSNRSVRSLNSTPILGPVSRGVEMM